ncbi:hypothetical protein SMD44_00269 [Streptomyces alboflavus]|uniref:Uncharacterized protein n=1 Tax=Streptomyces alboflavus TaxID=67267 RepID=A0A1Z1W378_9ACTN|nr:hypothetical protein SMD44_00269 [Streptomyces alboflavus]
MALDRGQGALDGRVEYVAGQSGGRGDGGVGPRFVVGDLAELSQLLGAEGLLDGVQGQGLGQLDHVVFLRDRARRASATASVGGGAVCGEDPRSRP